MTDLNQCNFIGRLGRDPEIKTFNDGGKVANFSIAVSKVWKDKQTGERKEKTAWVPIVARGGLSTVVERYVKKGSQVFVSGEFATREYTNRDGQKVYATEIIANELKLLGERLSAPKPGSKPPPADDFEDENIPF